MPKPTSMEGFRVEMEKTAQQQLVQEVQQPSQQPVVPQQTASHSQPEKFCKHCGGKIHADAVICPLCGRQVEEVKSSSNGAPPQVVINNSNNNVNTNTNYAHGGIPYKNEKNKWIALLLCFFLGVLGAHKFYEGKIGMGILYLFTVGLCGIGVIIDFIVLLFKPNPYYV